MNTLCTLSLALDHAIKELEKHTNPILRLPLEILKERKEYLDAIIQAREILNG